MLRKLVVFGLLTAISGSAWFLSLRLGIAELAKLAYSFLAIAAAYAVLKVFLDELVSRRIRDSRARYTFRKTIQLLFVLVSFVVVLRIWVPDPQALLVAYGLVAAGVAIALQDVFKNFAGSLFIFLSGIYRVGDRIEVKALFGDVIDIGLFYTTLIELREWVDGDQTTGRLTLLPNSAVLASAVHNYTKDHGFLWDEIELPVTHDSDWQKALQIIQPIVDEITAEMAARAREGVPRLEQKYFLSKRSFETNTFVTPTDNWIALRVRYVVDVKERRSVRNAIYERVLKAVQAEPDIEIASQTLTVSSPASVMSSKASSASDHGIE